MFFKATKEALTEVLDELRYLTDDEDRDPGREWLELNVENSANPADVVDKLLAIAEYSTRLARAALDRGMR